MSEAKVALGRRLFFDTRLSATGGYACASCHQPALAYTDGKALAVGATGESLPRSAAGLLNAAYTISYGWDPGGARSLERQMLKPMFNAHPIELGMRGRVPALLGALAADDGYLQSFRSAFPGRAPAITLAHLVDAIAAFERTLISGRSPFDRYVFGDERSALSDGAKRGMALFYSARIGCADCHFGINFSGPIAAAGRPPSRPLFANTGTGGAFRVPGLRNIALTAPYMHDGRFPSLPAVLAHYENAVHAPGADPRLRAFALGGTDRADLIAFLDSLTDAPAAAASGP
jgi:cytochrome c peroxidase